MNTKEISGRRQMEFLTGFDFVREAGTAGGSEGGEDDPGYFGQLRSEESDGGVFFLGFFGSIERCLRLWSLIRRSMW